MKRLFRFVAVTVATLSLNSCGLPGALGRSLGRVVNGADSMVGNLMDTN